jgi:hypothetical protein
MAVPYYLRFRAIALTLRAGLHSQPLMLLSVKLLQPFIVILRT